MRRSEGEVIFVDLMRGDDHILREMVEDVGGYSEVEAMALVDRFIFETKTAIERSGSATIAGFGTMTLDHNGVYQFHYSPHARPAKTEHAVQERLFEKEPVPHTHTHAHAPKPSPERTPAQPIAAHSRPQFGASAAQSRPRPAAPAAQGRPQPGRPAQQRPQGRNPRGKKRSRSRADTVLIIAIIAAIIAVIALAVALSWGGEMPFLSK
jgi:hypothetical protein